MLTAFDAQTWGTGGAGAAARLPAPVHLSHPNRRRAHTDVFINAGQQRPMRAPGHPQGSFITEIMMDELADAGQDGSDRVPPQESAAGRPQRDVGRVPARRGATAFGWDKRHPTGDRTPGPIKTGMGVAVGTVGRRRARPGAGAQRDRCPTAPWSCRSARRTSAPARARWSRSSPRTRWGCRRRDHARDRRHDVRRSPGSGGSTHRRRHQPGDSHRRRSRRSTRSRRKSRRRSVSTRHRSSRPADASRSRPTPRGRHVEGGLQADRARSRLPSTATGSPACRR